MMKGIIILLLLASHSVAFAPPRVPLTSQLSARSCTISTASMTRLSKRMAQSNDNDEPQLQQEQEPNNNNFLCSLFPPALGASAVVSFDALHSLINTFTDKQALFDQVAIGIPISILFASLVSTSLQNQYQKQVEMNTIVTECQKYKNALQSLVPAFPEPYQSKLTALLQKKTSSSSSMNDITGILQEMVATTQQQQEKVPLSLVQQAYSLVTNMDVSQSKLSTIKASPVSGFPVQASIVTLGSLLLLQILQQTDNAILWGLVVAIFTSLGVNINNNDSLAVASLDGEATTTTRDERNVQESRDLPLSTSTTEIPTTRQTDRKQPVAATTTTADSWVNETNVDDKDGSLLGALGGAASEIFQDIIKGREDSEDEKVKKPVKSKPSAKESGSAKKRESVTGNDSTRRKSISSPATKSTASTIAKDTTKPATNATQSALPNTSTSDTEKTKKAEAPKSTTTVGSSTTVPSRRNGTAATKTVSSPPVKSVPVKSPASSNPVTPVASSTSRESGGPVPSRRSNLPAPPKTAVPASTKSAVKESKPVSGTSIPAQSPRTPVQVASKSAAEASKAASGTSVSSRPPPAPVKGATKSNLSSEPAPVTNVPPPPVSVPSDSSGTSTSNARVGGPMRADRSETERRASRTRGDDTRSSGSATSKPPPSHVPLASDGSSRSISSTESNETVTTDLTNTVPPPAPLDGPVGETSVSATIPEPLVPKPAPPARPANGAFDRSSRVGPSYSSPAPRAETAPPPRRPPPPVVPAASTPGFGSVASASPVSTTPLPSDPPGVSPVTPNVESSVPVPPPSIPETPPSVPVASFDTSTTEARFADYVSSLGSTPATETRNSEAVTKPTGSSYSDSVSTESPLPQESVASDWVKNRESTSPIPAATVPMPGVSPAVAQPPAQTYASQEPIPPPPIPATPQAIPQPASEMIRPKSVEAAPGIVTEQVAAQESSMMEPGVAEQLKPKPPDASLFTEEMPIKMPIMGKYEIKVVKWYKQKGDMVEYNDLLCDIETEDFTFGMVNEEKFAAKMGDIAIPEGKQLYEGDLLCTLYHPKKAVARAMAEKAEAAAAAVPASAPTPSELSPSGFPTAVTEAFAKSRIGGPGNEPRFPGPAAREAANYPQKATRDPFVRNAPQASIPTPPPVRDPSTSPAPTDPVPAARSWGMETVTAPATSIPATPPVATPVAVPASAPDPTAISASTTASTTGSSTPAGADYLSALGGGPVKKMPPKSKPKAGMSTGASYLDNMSPGGSSPNWSRDAETTAPAPASSIPETLAAEETPVSMDRSKFTEPVLFRMPVMGKTQAKVIRWYKKEGDLVEYNDLLCDIETEDFTFGMVNEEEVDALMGEIAVAENSAPIGDGALLCTLFHPKQQP